MPQKFVVKEHSRRVHRVSWKGVKAGFEAWALLTSDDHWDSPDCDRALLERHHKEAQERNAPIFKFGDLFDVMQGAYDPRKHKEGLRPELAKDNYLDQCVRQAGEWYRRFPNIVLVTPGNHETAILKRQETNLTERLHHELSRNNRNAKMGAFTGFVLFSFDLKKGRTFCLHYHHGYGGGGEVTRGMIDNNRTRGQFEADVFYSGHIHRRNFDENIVERVAPNGSIVTRRQLFIRGSTYKNEGVSGDGWHREKGRGIRPLGGWWLRFRATYNDITCDAFPA